MSCFEKERKKNIMQKADFEGWLQSADVLVNIKMEVTTEQHYYTMQCRSECLSKQKKTRKKGVSIHYIAHFPREYNN